VPRSLRRTRALSLTGACAAAVLLVAGTVEWVSGGSSSDERVSFAGAAYPNIDRSNTRHLDGPIRTATVSKLELAWMLPVAAQSSIAIYSSSPVVTGGVAYWEDLASNVKAISVKSGELLWEKSYGSPNEGPNGVVVGDGRVYGATTTTAFALDQETGEELWSTNLSRGNEEIQMAPAHHGGLIYVSTVPTAHGGEIGVLWALDAKTGRRAWSFDTVPKALWGNPSINFGGGLSHTPAFDGKGSMYFGVGPPGPVAGTARYPWGSSRPGQNLYTGSIVKLDAKTGKLQWHYQVTPHALCNWGLEAPVILLKAGGRDLVVGAGKSGIVVALDRSDGHLVWRRPVGIHNGHDNDGLRAMRGEYSKLTTPMTIYPGTSGGVAAPLSASDSTVFVPVVNRATTLFTQRTGLSEGPNTGELVALDAASGTVRWKRIFPETTLGATLTVNDVLFTTTLDGSVRGFDAGDGSDVWEASLPAGVDAGATAEGGTLLVPADIVSSERQAPKFVAYRLRR